MLEIAHLPIESDNSQWAIRSEFWLAQLDSSTPKLRKRQRRTTPLILAGHGVSLRIENASLIIRDGFTHYPQEQAKYRFFPGDLEIPPRIILLDGSGTLSFEVLSWLSEQGVTLARVQWNGEVAIAVAGSGYAADPAKVEWQRATRADHSRRLAFASDLIVRKLTASIATLEKCFPFSPARETAIAKTIASIHRLQTETFSDMQVVFGIEGECASRYLKVWSSLALRWTGTSRRPIPSDWETYSARSSLLSGKVAKNRHASHPVNAMLNYAYTVRQTQLQIDAVARGYDPTQGIMHNRHQGSNAYILDLIEPERPTVDAAILRLVQERSFSAADFVIRPDGICRMSPQLARLVAAKAHSH